MAYVALIQEQIAYLKKKKYLVPRGQFCASVFN